jgi:carboxyl-terminal processing protease
MNKRNTRKRYNGVYNSGRISLGAFLAVPLAIAIFFSGIKIGQGVSNESQSAGFFGLFESNKSIAADTSVDEQGRPSLDEFWEVWDLLEKKFATGSNTAEVAEKIRLEGAIDGLVRAYGDPYTMYLPPKDAEAFTEDISGNFSGVGMEIGLRNRLLTVIAPLPDTPAEQAGILAGDIIVKINGSSTENMSIDQAVRKIRGEKGTVVDLEVYREGSPEFLQIPVTRDTIAIPTVKTEQVDDVFIVTLYSFNGVSEAKMRESMREFVASGATKLIVDLRGNPGGFLESSVAIASYFLPAGKVVVKEQFGDPSLNDVYRSRGGQVSEFDSNSLVVLVDGGSASASEILAGALKDHGVATIIGAQTFGKGSVQELVDLDNGSAVKVTVARWLTPSGTSISDGGLTPDIIISRTPQDRQAGEDPQREAALRFLAGEEVQSETFEDKVTASGDTEQADEGATNE